MEIRMPKNSFRFLSLTSDERKEVLARRVASLTGLEPAPNASLSELRQTIVDLERPSRRIPRAA